MVGGQPPHQPLQPLVDGLDIVGADGVGIGIDQIDVAVARRHIGQPVGVGFGQRCKAEIVAKLAQAHLDVGALGEVAVALPEHVIRVLRLGDAHHDHARHLTGAVAQPGAERDPAAQLQIGALGHDRRHYNLDLAAVVNTDLPRLLLGVAQPGRIDHVGRGQPHRPAPLDQVQQRGHIRESERLVGSLRAA